VKVSNVYYEGNLKNQSLEIRGVGKIQYILNEDTCSVNQVKTWVHLIFHNMACFKPFNGNTRTGSESHMLYLELIHIILQRLYNLQQSSIILA